MGYPVRPSGYIGWGSTGMTNTVEPSDSKKAVGWAGNEQPPSSYFNWLLAKQDEWIKYLSWQAQLTTVIEDDFISAWQPLTSTGGLGWSLMPQWCLRPEGAWALQGFLDQTNNLVPGAYAWSRSVPGVFALQAGGPFGSQIGIQRLFARISNVNGRDFKAEGHAYLLDCDHTGGAFQFGFYDASGIGTGSTGLLMGFSATGNSGNIQAVWVPSGGAQTSIAGSTKYYQSWAKYTIESRSPTMAFYVNDVLIGAAPAIAFGASGREMGFGVRLFAPNGTTGVIVGVDRLAFKMQRNPT